MTLVSTEKVPNEDAEMGYKADYEAVVCIAWEVTTQKKLGAE